MNKFLTAQGVRFFGILAFALIILLAASSVSFAHKVNIFAYVEGNQIITESYFPDGRKVEGGTIEVYDSQGNKLLTGTTDREGKFSFVPPKRDNLKIVLIATMGHKNSYLMSAEELPATVGAATAEGVKDAGGAASKQEGSQEAPKAAAPQPQQQDESNQAAATASGEVGREGQPSPSSVSSQVDVQEIRKIIDQSLDQKLAPIMRELAKAQEERVSPTQIFGGIGYIFGIVGLILYFTKKKE